MKSVWRRTRVAAIMMIVGVAGIAVWAALARPSQPAQTLQSALAQPARPLPEQIAADALGVDVSDIKVLQVDEKAGGREAVARIAIPAEEGTETVWVRYMTTDGSLLRITWMDRNPDAEEAVAISQDEAQKLAEQLKARLLPKTPYPMELTEARLHDQSPQYSFAWVGSIAEDVVSGDQVLVRVSAVTGKPIAYLQRVAHARPALADVPVSREQAVDAAAQATKGTWRDEFDREVTTTPLGARLVLSSAMSPQQGPVWLVDQEVKDTDGGERLELTQRAIDAMTGDVLQ